MNVPLKTPIPVMWMPSVITHQAAISVTVCWASWVMENNAKVRSRFCFMLVGVNIRIFSFLKLLCFPHAKMYFGCLNYIFPDADWDYGTTGKYFVAGQEKPHMCFWPLNMHFAKIRSCYRRGFALNMFRGQRHIGGFSCPMKIWNILYEIMLSLICQVLVQEILVISTHTKQMSGLVFFG